MLLPEKEILWISEGISCGGDSVSMTAATQPSIEDVVLGLFPAFRRCTCITRCSPVRPAGETRQRFPQITEDICMKSLQLVLPGGRVLSGADTLPLIAKRLGHCRFGVRLFRLPGAMLFFRRFYRWFTRHRHQISAVLFPGSPRGHERGKAKPELP